MEADCCRLLLCVLCFAQKTKEENQTGASDPVDDFSFCLQTPHTTGSFGLTSGSYQPQLRNAAVIVRRSYQTQNQLSYPLCCGQLYLKGVNTNSNA